MTNHPNRSGKKGRAVLVTTANRGVFFGYEQKRKSDTNIVLRNVRNCIQWRGLHGFLALTTEGPNSQCRIGPAASEVELLNVTSVSACSAQAAKAWEAAPWSR